MQETTNQQNSIFLKNDIKSLSLSHTEKRELKEKIQSAINNVDGDKG